MIGNLKVLTLEQSEEWDSIVRTFSQYDTYWFSGYVKAFQNHGDGEPLLIYYYDGNSIRGIKVVMKRDIADDIMFKELLVPGTYFDYSTPYGYGGWLIENPQNNDTEALFKDYGGYCQKHKVVSEFVRFHPMRNNHEAVSSFYDVIQLGEVVAIDLSSPETIWDNFSGTCRNRVRKSIKSNVHVYHGSYPEIYNTFQDIYNQTMDNDNAIDYYYFASPFYESIMNDLSENAEVFYAQASDGKIIAVAIMLTANGIMNYHLGGSLREYSKVAPMNQLFYKAALWGSANGFHTLYLGGGVGSGEDNLLRFKKNFYKGELSRFHIGKRILDENAYQKLLDIRKNSSSVIENTSFFPAYRG